MTNVAGRIATWARDYWQIKRNPIGYARRIGVLVGKDCKLGGIDRGTFGTEPYLITIGDHVELTLGVRFITHDGAAWVFRQQRPDIDVIAPIVIGNNVFVGMNAIFLPGTTVGNDVVIAAGAVVTGNIASNTVVGGIPARFICTIDTYRQRTFAKAIETRGMSRADKESFLRNRFHH